MPKIKFLTVIIKKVIFKKRTLKMYTNKQV
jgi:hypothetical protein